MASEQTIREEGEIGCYHLIKVWVWILQLERGWGRWLWRVFEQVQVIQLAPARLGGVELARLGIVPVVAALAPGAQVRLVVVRLVLVHVGDGQDDVEATATRLELGAEADTLEEDVATALSTLTKCLQEIVERLEVPQGSVQ